MATLDDPRSFRGQPVWSLPRDIAHLSPEDQAALLQLNAARTPYLEPPEYSMAFRRGLPYEFEGPPAPHEYIRDPGMPGSDFVGPPEVEPGPIFELGGFMTGPMRGPNREYWQDRVRQEPMGLGRPAGHGRGERLGMRPWPDRMLREAGVSPDDPSQEARRRFIEMSYHRGRGPG